MEQYVAECDWLFSRAADWVLSWAGEEGVGGGGGWVVTRPDRLCCEKSKKKNFHALLQVRGQGKLQVIR